MSRSHALTLGKYAPLHKGHQLVIETALAETDRLTVIIYDSPGTESMPLRVRAGWLRTLYPDITVIEAWDGPVEVGYTAPIMRAHEKYIIEDLKIRGISHFYSSEAYGRHMSIALGAINRTIDSERRFAPISASAIRADPYAQRAYIEPLVYRDLIVNVVFVGAPATGKTTLAERLAKEFNTVWMPEYGREFWHQHQVGRRLTAEQLCAIAQGHLERENALLLQARRYLFTDTNALTTATFARYYHGQIEPRLAHFFQQAAKRYDLVFLCDTDIPYDDTWDRSGGVKRDAFQRQVIADRQVQRIPYFTLRGNLQARIKQVRSVLSKYTKYANVAELAVR